MTTTTTTATTFTTSARVKPISSLKVVSGGCAPGKSSILASPQLSTSVTFHFFGAVRLGKVRFLYCADFKLIEGSLEVKLPTILTDEKQSWAEAERRGE